MLLAGDRGCGPHARKPGSGGRLRRLRDGQLFLRQRDVEPRPRGRDRHVPSAPHRQRQGLPRHPRQPRLRPARPVGERADGVFHLARRRASGVPVASERRMRRGAGGRRHDRAAARARLRLQPQRDPVARRPLPRLRPPGRGHGLRQRRGGRDAAPAGRCGPRPRPHLGRHQGHGGQQRRRRQGGLPCPQRRRAGAGDRAGARGGGRRRGRHRLCRMPRHRHRAGRSDRGRGADRRLRPHRAGRGGRADWVGQDQHRPPGYGGGGRQPHQGRAGAAPRADAAQPELRGAEPGHRLRRLALQRERRADAVPRSRPARARGGELAGRRRDERACGGGKGARAGGRGRIRLAVPAAGPVGPQPRGA